MPLIHITTIVPGCLSHQGAVFCPRARHFIYIALYLFSLWKLPDMAEKIVDWDVKPQHKQTNKVESISDIYLSK